MVMTTSDPPNILLRPQVIYVSDRILIGASLSALDLKGGTLWLFNYRYTHTHTYIYIDIIHQEYTNIQI